MFDKREALASVRLARMAGTPKHSAHKLCARISHCAGKLRRRTSTRTACAAHLRVARPTDNLRAVERFYRDGLGFDVLGRFEDHEGFSGVMLGHPRGSYHLEFTHHHGHTVGRAPTKDHLLVFYLPEEEAWEAAVARLEAAGGKSVPACNPYWDKRGKTFEDPDGYGVVLQNASWPGEALES